MEKETDLPAVKQLAISMLYLDIATTEFSPVVVKHPFTDSGFVSLPRKADEPFQIGNLLDNPEHLEKWRCAMRNRIEKANTVTDITMMLTVSYMFAFLRHAAHLLSKKDMSELLAYFWIHCECPNEDPNLSGAQLLRLFQNSDPAFLMSDTEYAVFQGLEELVPIYRGVTSRNKKHLKKALSWTLDPKTASWFAHRYGENGEVWMAFIDRKHIYAYFDGRGESEVICNPKHINSYIQLPQKEN